MNLVQDEKAQKRATRMQIDPKRFDPAFDDLEAEPKMGGKGHEEEGVYELWKVTSLFLKKPSNRKGLVGQKFFAFVQWRGSVIRPDLFTKERGFLKVLVGRMQRLFRQAEENFNRRKIAQGKLIKANRLK